MLNAQLNHSKNTVGTVDYFWQSLRKNEHIMLMTTKNADIPEFEVAFFRKGLAEGAILMKGCWWQDKDEVVEQYMRLGFDAESLIRDKALNVIDLSKLYRDDGVDGPVRAWRLSIGDAAIRGAGRLWASGSPNMSCCGSDSQLVVAFETRLHEAVKDAPVIGFCPYSLQDESNTEHFGSMISLMSRHSGVAFYSDGQYSLMRQ